jgi:hypothetical protein
MNRDALKKHNWKFEGLDYEFYTDGHDRYFVFLLTMN